MFAALKQSNETIKSNRISVAAPSEGHQKWFSREVFGKGYLLIVFVDA